MQHPRNSSHPRRAFGLLLLLVRKAFRHAGRKKPMKPMKLNRKVVALVVTLVIVLVVLPAIASVVGTVVKARWEATHPAQTMVPDLTGHDRADAEAAIRSAQLRPIVTFVPIKDKCWQDQPTPNKVADQDPPPITPVPINSEVHVVIALDEPRTVTLDKRCCGQSP
jgi:hypothetical protein